jgi:tetratricopeptide (TPR) repeat protein
VDATSHLKSSIDSYNSALSNIHLRIDIKTYELVKGIHLLSMWLITVGMSDLKIQGDRDECLSIENFVVPYEKNPQFTGRKKFLKTLKEKMSDKTPKKYNHRIALYGMGGIGKTQTALEYVYTEKDSYERIYWITAVDQASLLSGYQKIAIKAGLKSLLNLKLVEIVEGVLSWLRQTQSWLLVIDNLDDINVAAGFLPQNGPHQHTLITTRNPNSAGIPAEGLEVPLLDPADSIELLSTLSNITIVENSQAESVQADQIVQELGYLPLGIEQAAAYVREIAGDFTTFLADYNKSHKDVHQWVPQGNRLYAHSVATTWSMSFNIVRNNHPQAAELLQLLSFLNPDGILIDFLQDGIEALQDNLRQVVSNRIDFSKALIELEKFSLIKWNRLTRTLLIHRLMQMVVKDEMSDAGSMTLRNTIINLCDRSFPQEWGNENRELCRVYVSQIMGSLLDVKVIRTEKSATVMYRIGWFLRYDGKISDSERVSLKAVEISTEILSSDHYLTLSAMDNLAMTYLDQGRTEEATRLHEEVLEKRRRILDEGDDHPDTLTTMNNLALAYRDQKRTEEAARLQEEVLEKRRRILGDDHPYTLTTMDSLASIYQDQGRTEEAARLHEEVLEKRRWIQGDDHPHTLMTMDSLASTYLGQGRTEEATRLHKEVLEKRRRILGDDHPHTLMTMDNLAFVYQTQGRTEEAARLDEEVLEKRRRIQGDDHPHTLTTMNNLAFVYQTQGRTEEAVRLHEEVLEKRRRILGDDHPDTLTTMDSLTSTYQAQGRTEEAARFQEAVLEKRRRIQGGDP